jgi:hypothetical protein
VRSIFGEGFAVVNEIRARAKALGRTLERIGRQVAAQEPPALAAAGLVLDLERMARKLDRHAQALADGGDETPPALYDRAE